MAEKHQTIIIGGGPAGLTAAIYLKRAGYEVLVLEQEETGGQIRISNEVVNYPGIEKTDGETLSETMRRQAIAFGADIHREKVVSLSLTENIKVVQTDKNHYEAPVVVYAAGAIPRKLNFPGEKEFGGRGIAYCATCDGELFAGKPIFVVGGGYAAAEEALYLTRYSKPITMIVREPDFTCAKELADKVKHCPDVKIEYNTEISRVEGKNIVQRVVFHNSKSDTDWEYENQDAIGIFIFAGYLPQTDMIKNQVVCDKQGYIVTDDGCRTNIEGVYGAGDVCQKRLRQLVTATADGAMAAETIAADYPLEQMPKVEISHKEKEDPHTGPGTNVTPDHQNVHEGALRPDSVFHEIYPQIKEVEKRFETVPQCRVFLSRSEVSGNVKKFMEEFETVMPGVSVSYEEMSGKETDYVPCISISSKDGKRRGMYFHGTPGGHEFSTFLSALYQAAGPGKPLMGNILNQVRSIVTPVRLDVGVTLGCNQCPELASSAMTIGAYSPMVEVHLINVAEFPEFKEKHQVFSVPFLLVNEKHSYFGKKNTEQLMEIIGEIIGKEVV